MKEKGDERYLGFKRLRSFAVLPALVMTLALFQPAFAGDYPPRVSHIEGSAAYEPAGEVDWNEVAVNLPLLSGDRIFAQQASRVEIDLGDANFIRLGEETDLVFLRVDRRELGLELRSGQLILRVNRGERFNILTPIGNVSIRHKGLYRISVEPGGTTEVAVRGGRAEVDGAGRREKLKAGDRLIVDTSRSGAYYVTAGYYPDDLDQWSDRRDARFVTSRSVAYVGGVYYPGIWDLDYYGSWAYYPAYGRVWVPRVSVGWVPYRVGRWSYYSWGWTWISYEPWGWLPYHYGNWVHFGGRWGWVPGGFHSWSPAVVNFYYGSGHVGWAPRGPRGGTTIIDNRVVINNNTTIINEAERRGMTVVRQDEFGGRRGGGPTNFTSPSRQVVEGLRGGLPNDLRDPAAIRARTQVSTGGSGVTSPARPDPGARGRTSFSGTPSVGKAGETPRVGRTIDAPPSARPRVVEVPSRTQSPGTPAERPGSDGVRARSTPPPAAGGDRAIESPASTPNVITVPRVGRTVDAPRTTERSPRIVGRDTAPPPPPQESRSLAPAPTREPAPGRSAGPTVVSPARDTRPEVRSTPPPAPTRGPVPGRSAGPTVVSPARDTRPEVRSTPPSAPTAPRSVRSPGARPETPSVRPRSSAPPRSIAPSAPRSVQPSSPAVSRSASPPRPQVQRAPSAPSRPATPSRPPRRPDR
jgi:hypothetical protein